MTEPDRLNCDTDPTAPGWYLIDDDVMAQSYWDGSTWSRPVSAGAPDPQVLPWGWKAWISEEECRALYD